MQAGGDILVTQKSYEFPLWADQIILAANAGPFAGVFAVRNSNYTIYVQKIVWSIATHAAQTITFQDSASTPVKIGSHLDVTPQAAGVPSVVTWDFGPHGVALTAGKNLDITLSGAGCAGVVHLEGYQRLTTTGALTNTAANQ